MCSCIVDCSKKTQKYEIVLYIVNLLKPFSSAVGVEYDFFSSGISTSSGTPPIVILPFGFGMTGPGTGVEV